MPTAVVITMQDDVVPLRRQMQLFEAIPAAQAFRVDAGHDAIVARPDRVRCRSLRRRPCELGRPR